MQKIRSFVKDLLVYTFEKVLLRKPASILMYHSISNKSEFFTVTPENFEWQMKYLYENKYNVIPLSQLVEKRISNNSVIITIDDGYQDNFSIAYPVLKKYNFPATIFLTTGSIGTQDYMNWDEVIEMHKSGLVDFQPHTVNHPKLSQLSLSEAEREIMESKLAIERKLDKKCEFFCLPFGNYNSDVIKLVKGQFRACFTVKRGFVGKSDNIYELKRNSVDSLVGKWRFRLKV